MAIYPQFVQAWIPSPDPQTDSGAATVHVTVAAGDTLLILGSTAASSITLSAPTGGGLSYTLQAQTPVTSGYDNQYEWTATSATAQTFTLSVSGSGSGDWGFIVQRWANVGAIGSVAKGTGTSSAPSLSLTTTQAYSAIVFAASDFNGTDGSGRVWNTSSAGTLTEDHYDRDPGRVTNYIGHYNNPGAAGAKTVGLTAPSITWSATAIELIGLSATPYAQNPADTVSLTDGAGTLVNGTTVPSDQAAVSDAAASSLGHFGTASDNAALSDAATALRENRSADTAALSDAVTIIQAQSLLLSEVVSVTDTGGLGTNSNTDPNIGRLPNGSTIAILTRPDITNYQFMVDTAPWCPFGEGQAVNVAKFTPGGSSVRVQDVPGATADNVWFGVDYHTPGAWTWDLFTDAGVDPGLALSWVDVLDQVWNDPVRLTSNGALPLRYCVAGRIRRVYGRPRRWTPIHDTIQHGKVKITCDFQLSEDETYYDDVEQSATVGFAPAVVSGSFWKFPIIFPLAVQTPGAIRSEQIVIGGTQSTWVVPTFHGPVSNPWVQFDLNTGGSFRWALNGTLPAGTSMTLSGRPWDTGVFAGDGTYHPEMLDPRARLSQLRLKPGTYSVSFGGLDVTSTATVTVTWRNAYRSL